MEEAVNYEAMAQKRPLLHQRSTDVAQSVAIAAGYAVDWKAIFDVLLALFKALGPCLAILAFQKIKRGGELRNSKIANECMAQFGEGDVATYSAAAIRDLCQEINFQEFKALLKEAKQGSATE